MNGLKSYALYFAWVIALCGLLISLYFGELLRYEPCHLCWYQRIFLFPLVILLGMGTYREDYNSAIYGIALAILGGLFALYQIVETYIPALRVQALCGEKSSCTESVFLLFGWISFPILSLAGFALIAMLLGMVCVRSKP